MDGQEYLNQISAKNKPVQQSKLNKILTNKFFLIGAGALVLLIIIMITGAALSSGKGNEKKESIALFLHLNNTSEVIDEYYRYANEFPDGKNIREANRILREAKNIVNK